MNKLFLCISLAVFNIYFSNSQNRKLNVLDSITKLPVKYANINFLNGYGVFSSEKGEINISDININSLEISHVSYELKKIELKINDSIIFLKPKIINLDEVVIKNNQKLNVAKKINSKPIIHSDYNKMYYSAIGLKFAFKINPNNTKINYLKSTEIPLFKKTNDVTRNMSPEKQYPYKTLIKLEILECVNGMPGENLNDYCKYEVIDSELINDSFTTNFKKTSKFPKMVCLL
jgi:hypothetical protein